ncbi:MAG: MoxR family ATPase [Pseudomonadales bacterium]|nr:MoxR family ATPase [Pseudomonadales bacterium]
MNSHLEQIQTLTQQLSQQIIGQQKLVESLMIALLADGHLLVEGAPGLAKTRAIKCLSSLIEGSFHRVQFTPDLLPGDITGTEIYRPQDGTFEFQKGPIFHSLVLADEINRAPAKAQSALLEAMGERQVSVGKTTYPLPQLFLVMATQNPIEQEGTYPLPEAQLDRFLLHVEIGYPDREAEHQILKLARYEASQQGQPKVNAGEDTHIISQDTIFEARQQLLTIHMAEPVEEYIVQLIMATRHPQQYDAKLASWLEYGASPRGTIALDSCARAHAWLAGRDFVTPDDVQAVIHNVLRHRLIPSFEAEASGISSNELIDQLLNVVPAI